jgi:hypothetical protein
MTAFPRLLLASRLAILFSLALLAGCATPYQPMSALGGYREIQLAPDIYRVMFFGNGYTNSELAVEYSLRRCAELTEQNGYRYFGILSVEDLSTQSSFTIPGSAYTTGNVNVNQVGNMAFGTYTGHTFITPAQTVHFNFPRPVITIKMLNAEVRGATLFEAASILSNRLPGVPAASTATITPASAFSTANLRRVDDPQLKARVVSFVKEFLAAGQSGSSLPSPASFYGPNVLFNGKELSHEAMAQQIQSAFAMWPQRKSRFISEPTVLGRLENGEGIVVSCKVAFEFSNGRKRIEGKAAYQLTVEDNGNQLVVTTNSPQILELHVSS